MHDALVVRELVNIVKLCDPIDTHVWSTFDSVPPSESTAVLALCGVCGRTPFEALMKGTYRSAGWKPPKGSGS